MTASTGPAVATEEWKVLTDGTNDAVIASTGGDFFQVFVSDTAPTSESVGLPTSQPFQNLAPNKSWYRSLKGNVAVVIIITKN